jgi:multiple antibiotic resistance protein
MLPFILRHDAPAEMAYASDCANRAAVVNGVVSAFLLTFAALFPIVNPIEGAPFFLAMTAHVSSAERRVLARNVAINGFALLLGSMVLGPFLLQFFGIELPVVRIAGGLVVTALGWKLLTEEQWSDHGEANVQPGNPRQVGSFYPLTMPLTVGPGSISVAITIGSRKPDVALKYTELALHAIGALLGVVAIAASIYVAYRFAGNLARVLGVTGLEVMVRLSAFILMCIGIEIVWNGYSSLVAIAH